jgi:hypothetical protein
MRARILVQRFIAAIVGAVTVTTAALAGAGAVTAHHPLLTTASLTRGIDAGCKAAPLLSDGVR